MRRIFVNPSSPCICRNNLGGRDLAVLESGQIRGMKKDDRFMRFYPDWLSQEGVDKAKAQKVIMHEECVVEAALEAGIDIDKEAPEWRCQSCDHSFRTDRWAYRLTFGEANKNCTFCEDGRAVILCSYCVATLFDNEDDDEVMDD